MFVKLWFDDKHKLFGFCLAPEGKRDIGGGLSVCPSVCCPPGKSFRLKFLMYIWNTFRGHIKLQKHFRWTVWRSNIDIMIHADEKKNILMIFLLFVDFAIISA